MNAGTQLCKTCATLGLEKDKFIIQKRAAPKRPISRRLLTSNSSDPLPVKSGFRDLRLGTLLDIEGRQGNCPVCWLIAKSVESHSLNPLEDETSKDPRASATCFLRWEIDGRAALDVVQIDTINKTRRLRILWDDPKFKSFESYLVLAADDHQNWPNSDIHSVWKDDIQYLGRSINPSLGKQSLAVSWMQLCDDRHDHRCNGPMNYDSTTRFRQMLEQSYFGVIDVTNLQLTRLPIIEGTDALLPQWAPYVTLSYMWGQVESELYRTKRSNILIYKSHGGLEHVFAELPKTIRDAIHLVRQLGIQFIWIDSLCIVQDSPRSWRLNSQNMDLIYGNSALTICAADGDDAEAGLRAMETQTGNEQHSRECAPGITLMISRPPETRIRASKWNHRAWTFQERLLSPRTLIFVDGRMYWQCRSTSMSEDIFRDGQGASWSLDSIQAPLQLLEGLPKRAFWFYMKCIPLYTSRDLTDEGDILAAFNGVSRLMEKYLKARFIFGLPTSHLDLALLWQPQHPLRRRTMEKPEQKWKDLEFPSWSWAGWTGAMINYDTDTLRGCLENVQCWLMNHTWICWHIRDGNGNLRPLWDRTLSKQCSCASTKWRGYKGQQDEDSFLTRTGKPVSLAVTTATYMTEQGKVAAKQLEKHIAEYPQQRRIVRARKDEDRVRPRISEQNARTPSRPPIPVPPAAQPIIVDERTSQNRYRRPRLCEDTIRQSRYAPYLEEPPSSHLLPSRSGHMQGMPFPGMESGSGQNMYPADQTTRKYIPQDGAGARKEAESYGYHNSDSGQDSNPSCDFEPAKNNASKKRKPAWQLHFQDRQQKRYHFNDQFDKALKDDLFDKWGRAVRPEIKGQKQREFALTTPENPYSVLRSDFSKESDPNLPDMPVLQFWTWQTSLQVRHNDDTCMAGDQGLCRADIVDLAGDWCGSVLISHEWFKNAAGRPLEDLIALSEAKEFTEAECPVWTYYIPIERDESEWDLFYVLLIEYSPETNAYERVALGKVFKAAFKGCAWTEIILG